MMVPEPGQNQTTATAEMENVSDPKVETQEAVEPLLSGQDQSQAELHSTPVIRRLSLVASMTKTALKACHTQEIQPEILLRRAMKRTDPMLFRRLDHDMDKYTNLEEFSLLKSSASACEPLTIAVASPEASQIFKSCWNAMNCQNHATMMRPPFGPASPSNCISITIHLKIALSSIPTTICSSTIHQQDTERARLSTTLCKLTT